MRLDLYDGKFPLICGFPFRTFKFFKKAVAIDVQTIRVYLFCFHSFVYYFFLRFLGARVEEKNYLGGDTQKESMTLITNEGF